MLRIPDSPRLRVALNWKLRVAIEFLGSYVGDQELPAAKQPRIAFLGRSNVGKSSLINLLTSTNIARVSKTPGRTRALNLFRIHERWIFGDFPGYGFAKVSKQERKQWEGLIEKYLTAENFSFAVQIVDSRHPDMDSDIQLRNWLIQRNLRCVVVLNKSDKLNQKERVEADRKAKQIFSGQPLLFASTLTKEGKRELEKILGDLR